MLLLFVVVLASTGHWLMGFIDVEGIVGYIAVVDWLVYTLGPKIGYNVSYSV